MAVKALYALQNGFMGFERTGLFYGERSPERVAIPVTCYLAQTGDAVILFDTGISPRAVPGLRWSLVKLERDADLIRLSVRDWGPGIDPGEHEQIFDRFYRAKAIRLKPIRGSGIGLALVRHIARAHHGDVTVDSTPGVGSTFQIWLPIDDRT